MIKPENQDDFNRPCFQGMFKDDIAFREYLTEKARLPPAVRAHSAHSVLNVALVYMSVFTWVFMPAFICALRMFVMCFACAFQCVHTRDLMRC